jgi:hypothetical protein
MLLVIVLVNVILFNVILYIIFFTTQETESVIMKNEHVMSVVRERI